MTQTHAPAPITCAPRFLVTCWCGFAKESAQDTAKKALAEVGEHHRCPRSRALIATAVDYSVHPLYKAHARTCRACREHFAKGKKRGR